MSIASAGLKLRTKNGNWLVRLVVATFLQTLHNYKQKELEKQTDAVSIFNILERTSEIE